MTDDDLERLVRSAVPPAQESVTGDVWPRVLERIDAPRGWAWFDMGLAAAVVVVLALFPEWLSLLAYHL